MKDKNRQLLTSGIKHWGLSGYSSILPRIKFGVTGQESSPQSPTISYRRPLATSVKKDNPTASYDNDKIEIRKDLAF